MTTPNPANWRSHTRAETPTYAAWAPGDGRSNHSILVALRGEGYLAQIGSRVSPAGNFEVRYLGHQEDRVAEIILGFDPGATRLTVGR